MTTWSPAKSLANNNCTPVTGKVAARPTITFPVTSPESSLTLCHGNVVAMPLIPVRMTLLPM